MQRFSTFLTKFNCSLVQKHSFSSSSLLKNQVVYVANFPWNTTEDNLKEAFNSFGEIESVRIVTDKNTGKPRGFGYISFVNAEDAKESLKLSGTDFSGRELKVDLSTPIAKKPIPEVAESNSLFLSNVKYEMTEDELLPLFPTPPVAVRFLTDRGTGRSRGMVFVDFETIEEAKNALKALEGCEIGGREIRSNFAVRQAVFNNRPQRERETAERFENY